jgi:hypothetical protein
VPASDFWLQILYTAAASKLGVVVAVSGQPEIAKAQFYKARTGRQDAALARLQLRSSPDNPQEIWILNVEAGAAA